MTKNNERKQELVEYIELLGKLQGNGLKYNLEINKAVKELNSLVMDSKSECIHSKFYDNFSCINGEIGKLVIVNETHRGTGKTSTLIIVAKEEKLPIIVGNNAQKEYVLNRSVELKQEIKEVYTVSDLRGRRFPNGVLIDDTVSVVDAEKIRLEYNIIIRGGFIYSNFFV